ncbi:MAG: CPBP family intramembrane metalloprotease [Verrucomicrobiae bacterium]|nr:CPBP family intramembrane metalloprotease [Verrucomicrobiae bacterium]
MSSDPRANCQAEPGTGRMPPPIPREPATPWGFWATVGLGLAIAAGSFVAQAVIGVIYAVVAMAAGGSIGDPEGLESDGFFLALATIGGGVVGVGLVILVSTLRRSMNVREYLGLHMPPLRATLGWIGIFLVAVAIGDTLTYFIGKDIVPDFMIDIDATARFRPLLWFTLIIMAPLFEESFFRGFLIPGFAKSPVKAPGAILLTSALWTIIHFQYEAFHMGVIFVAGILLGIVRIKTGSLILCILLHMLMNTVATVELEIYKAMRSPATAAASCNSSLIHLFNSQYFEDFEDAASLGVTGVRSVGGDDDVAPILQ